MLKTDGTFDRQGASSLALVSTIRALDIEIPEAVTAEVKLYSDLKDARGLAQRDYDAAVSTLRSVEVDKFDAAKTDVVNASVQLFAITQGVDNILVKTVADRLANRVYDAAPGWESAVVERFNETVAHYELNDVAADLPDFSDPGSFNVLSLGERQGHAIARWRTAADYLNPLWSAYRKLAVSNGHELGPVDAGDRATNLFTACVIGDPGSLGTADAAATKLASIAVGGKSVKAYAAITPFVVPALVGYDLHLHTIGGAAVIRQQIQPAA